MSDTSSDIEPEQYPTKLEKPKRQLSQKQLDALAKAREKRKMNKASTQAPTEVPTQAPTEEPTQVEKEEPTQVKKIPLSKMNKKDLEQRAKTLNIDITGLNNQQIKKKIRDIEHPKEVKEVIKEVIKEVPKVEKPKAEKPKVEKPKVEKTKKPKAETMSIKKSNNIINFV